MIKMPDVLCDGHVWVTVVDPRDDEVRVGMSTGHVVYLKRDKRESYEEFIARVTAYCETEYKSRSAR